MQTYNHCLERVEAYRDPLEAVVRRKFNQMGYMKCGLKIQVKITGNFSKVILFLLQFIEVMMSLLLSRSI